MPTAAENLNAAVNALVESKTFTVEAADAIARLRANVETVTKENGELKHTFDTYMKENAALAMKVHEQKTMLDGMTAREAAVLKREAAMTELEKKVAVSEARSDTFKECFGLVFRNAEIRTSMFGSAPRAGSSNPNQYVTDTVAVSQETTKTIA